MHDYITMMVTIFPSFRSQPVYNRVNSPILLLLLTISLFYCTALSVAALSSSSSSLLPSPPLRTAGVPLPNLPFGEINVVVLTDVHSWVAGHGHQEPDSDVDYGDVLSFYERLREYFDETAGRIVVSNRALTTTTGNATDGNNYYEKNNVDGSGSIEEGGDGQRGRGDLWFVSNGDWLHGTGLGAPGDSSDLVPLLEKMPWDAVNCGNHELYDEDNVEYMTRPGGFVDWWGDRYLTTNILYRKGNSMSVNGNSDGNLTADSSTASRLGRRYKVLRGKYSDLMVFGFLYNMEGACSSIEVEKVENVVREQWFKDTLDQERYDAILVLAHMDLVDPLVTVILSAIRQHVGEDMPVQFITGHTHYRGVTPLDASSTSFEAGRYLDTIGFVSFPTAQTIAAYMVEKEGGIDVNNKEHETKKNAKNGTDLFRSVFLDSNRQVLAQTLNVDTLETKNGRELSQFIAKTREKMGLLKEIGCAPNDFYYQMSMDNHQSLWRLSRDVVIPKMFFDQGNPNSMMLLSNQNWRYDLLSSSPLLLDDIVAVSPFNDSIVYVDTFPTSIILQLNMSLNEHNWMPPLPNYVLVGGSFDNDDGDEMGGNKQDRYKLYTSAFDVSDIKKALKKILPDKNIEPTWTPYAWTTIWESFVIENWPCDGKQEALSDPFPAPPNNGTKAVNMETEKGMTKGAAFFMRLGVISFLGCYCYGIRYFYRTTGVKFQQEGHIPVLQDLDAVTIDDNDYNDDRFSDNKGGGM